MSKKISQIKEKHFPKGGDTRKLGVSREYLDLVIDGVVPASDVLLLKLINNYNISLNVFHNEKLVSQLDDQFFLRASEALSHNANFLKSLSREDVDSQKLQDLVLDNYNGLHVLGRLSTILTNFPGYFASISTDINLDVFAEAEFNDFVKLRNPFVALHSKNVNPRDFIHFSGSVGKKEYFVAEEFLPRTVKSISTDYSNWKPRFQKGVFSKIAFNKVFVEYKKPVSQEVLDSLRDDVDNKYFNPDFLPFSKGTGGVLFDELITYSKLDKSDFKKVETDLRHVMKLEDVNVVSFYFYPIQLLGHAMKSGGGDNFYPTPATLHLANRFQQYMGSYVPLKK